MNSSKYMCVPVAGNAYPGKTIKAALTHAALIEDGCIVSVACDNVKVENLLDDSCMWNDVSKVTCKACQKKMKV